MSKKDNLWPKVREVEHNNGTTAFRVDARIQGKGERFFFPTIGEARTKADQLRIERGNSGIAAVRVSSDLRDEAARCLARLQPVGATLTEAVDYFLTHARPAGGVAKTAALIETFLAAKEANGKRPAYTRILRSVLTNFSEGTIDGQPAFGEREIHTIGSKDIAQWMTAQPWSLRTRSNVRLAVGSLFNYAIKEGHTLTNPARKIEVPKWDEPPPGILTIEQTSRLLTAAESFAEGALLPYVAIGLFCGLRASELAALEWKEISIEERTVEVTAKKAKTRARRLVTMPDNLALWLAPYAKRTGFIAPQTGLVGRWERLREAAGFGGPKDVKKGKRKEVWPENGMRHSYASYHVATHNNAPKTSLEMGHDRPDELFTSYRALVKPAAAAAYWKIAPTAGEKIVPMVA